MTEPTTDNLLPRPRTVEAATGQTAVTSGLDVQVHCEDSRIQRAARAWKKTLADRGGKNLLLTVAVDRTVTHHSQGYVLRIEPGAIELLGGSPVGCYYGLQTLAQLAQLGRGVLPCCRIEDEPDFATRGLLCDITRGKVPTLETLKRLVDRLAAMKINQLQLYIEHAFVFSFDPLICDAEHGLTPDDVRELDAFARDRFIDLVPALATFGHVGRILSMPRYRHLAEIEATKSWADMSWPQRARGLTLDCMNPEAHKLVDHLWSDVLEAFSSPVVNICGDEPWDLGQGKNKDRLPESARGEAYLAHIRRTTEFCAGRGRRCQAWSDVIRNYPHLFHRCPDNLTILHWGYDDKSDYNGVDQLVSAGLETFVCPGTSGWKRIINAVGLAERNIASFAQAGKRFGATGLLNTDWGEHGHFNLLACSWHGIAMGAAKGWCADHPTGAAFDESFGRVVLELDASEDVARLGTLLRKASTLAESCETWRMMWTPTRALRDDPMLPTVEEAEASRQHSIELSYWCERARSNLPADGEPARDLAELAVAAEFAELLADKLIFVISGPHSESSKRLWPQQVREAEQRYAACWLARNKNSGLDDIRQAISSVISDIHAPAVRVG